jgi:hypothetical protein
VTESAREGRGETVKGIAISVAFVAIMLGAMVLAEFLNRVVDGERMLRWAAAIPKWPLLIIGLAYVYWLTRKLLEMDRQQKELLQLLKQRSAD